MIPLNLSVQCTCQKIIPAEKRVHMALVGLLKACLGDGQYVPVELHLDSTIEALADRTERRKPKVSQSDNDKSK